MRARLWKRMVGDDDGEKKFSCSIDAFYATEMDAGGAFRIAID